MVYKGEVDVTVLIGMIFLGRPRGFGFLVGALRFKLDCIRWSIRSLAPYFDLLIYRSLAINSCLVLIPKFKSPWLYQGYSQ